MKYKLELTLKHKVIIANIPPKYITFGETMKLQVTTEKVAHSKQTKDKNATQTYFSKESTITGNEFKLVVGNQRLFPVFTPHFPCSTLFHQNNDVICLKN